MLSVEEIVAYDIGLNLLKYDYTPEPESELDQGSLTRSDPQPSPTVRRNQWKKSNRPESSQSRENLSKTLDLTRQEIEKMLHSFDNAIRLS